jgi:hypothetical protein
MPTTLVALVAGGVFAVSSVQGQTWVEAGDAGDAPIGSSQLTVGVGALTSITGGMDWVNQGDHVDAFQIKIVDVAAFFASTDPFSGGSFIDNGGNEDNSRLFLFDLAGNLVFANDNAPAAVGGSLESYISDPSTYPGALFNDPGVVVEGNDYILAVTYFINNLVAPGPTPYVDFSADSDALHGINPAAGDYTDWTNIGDPDDSWTYEIALGGTAYAVIPGPTSLGLLAVGLLASCRRRR